MKILITTVFFPPQNAIASQRPYSWARAWSQAGHDVTVLTIEKDRNRTDLAPMAMEGFRTIEVPTGGLIGWLRSRRKKSRASVSTAIPSSARKPSAFSNWLRRRGWLSSVRWPDVFDFWVPSAVKHIPQEKFDLIVSTFGPPASLAVGYRAKRMNPKATWVCDFRDLWTENHVYPGFWPFTVFEKFAERFYLARASCVTTVSSALADSLRAKVRVPVEVFENGFFRSELASLDPTSIFSDSSVRHLVYTGSLHPEQRNPKSLLVALSKLPPDIRSKLRVVFVGPQESFLESLVKELGVQDCVQSMGSVARRDSLRYQRDADVLLFFEKQHEKSKDGVLTGKLFEYLATGRPIWVVGLDEHSTVGSLVLEGQCGKVLSSDIARIQNALTELVRSDRACGRNTDNADDVSRRYERTDIARRMLEWVNTADAKRP